MEEQDPHKLIERVYSIASSSVRGEFMEFYVQLVRSGALTPRLFALQHGERVWLSPQAKGQGWGAAPSPLRPTTSSAEARPWSRT